MTLTFRRLSDGIIRIVPSLAISISIRAPVCSTARMARAISAWVARAGLRDISKSTIVAARAL